MNSLFSQLNRNLTIQPSPCRRKVVWSVNTEYCVHTFTLWHKWPRQIHTTAHLSTYLVVCSSGGVPATSVLGSEGALSTVTPEDPGDPAGDVAAVWEGGTEESDSTNNTESAALAPERGWLSICLWVSHHKPLIALCLSPWSDVFWVNVKQQMEMSLSCFLMPQCRQLLLPMFSNPF